MTGNVASALKRYVHEREDLLIDVMRRLVEAESPSAHPAIHDATRLVLAAAFHELDFMGRDTFTHVRQPGKKAGAGSSLSVITTRCGRWVR